MLEQAEQEYSAILEGFPRDRPSILGLSRVQSILSKQRTSEVARQNRETGLKKFRWGDYAAAAMYLSASVDAGLNDTATLYSLGMSYLKLGRPSEARTVLDRCVAARPDYAPALVGLAEVEKDRGSKDQAVLLLKRALELGGGAEFTPVRIMEMISALAPETKSITNHPQQVLTVAAVHRHGFPFSRCRGQLIIDGSVIRFNSDNPSHSFSVSRAAVAGARASGSQLTVEVNGKPYTLTLKGASALDFLNATTR
jgi:tetratricopeptide (TPR) repeat protein